MPFYEYEYTLIEFNKILKERQEGENKKSKDYEDKYNIHSMQSQMTKTAQPKMPSFNLPKMK